ncbi:MAG: hypothetical protein AAGI38_00730 [Bacteroidota bacterium]
MKMNLILCFLFANSFLLLEAQITSTEHDLNKASDDFFTRKVYMLGETHIFPQENNELFRILIDRVIKAGSRNINLCYEYPPSFVYFLKKYFLSEKDSAALVQEGYILESPTLQTIDYIGKYRDSVTFNFISIDIEFGSDFRSVREMQFELLGMDTPEFYNFEAPDFLYPIRNARSRSKIQKWAQSFMMDDSLQAKCQSRIDSTYWLYFYQSMRSIASYGFMKGGKTDRKLAIRDAHMAQTIEDICDDSSVCVMSLGQMHIKPQEGKQTCNIVQNLKRIQRNDICLIPIVYPNGEWLGSLSIYYKNEYKTYPKDGPYKELIQAGIFDMIVFPPGQISEELEGP